MTTEARLVQVFEAVCRYASFGEPDLAILRDCHREVSACFDEVVAEFYRYILADDVTRRILEEPERVERLMRTFRAWLDELFLSPRNVDYHRQRYAIGTTHVRVGLPFPYVFAAMSHVRCRLQRAVSEATKPNDAALRDKRLRALGRALDLDLALISGSYHEADKYRDLVEAAPEMIHTIDRSGMIIDVNRTVEKRLGLNRDRLVRRSLREIVHPLDRERLDDHIDRLFERGEDRCEVRLFDAAGTLCHVELLSSAERDLYSNAVHVGRIWMRDITERRKAESDLVRERELERKYLEVADVILLVLDADGRVKLVNRKGCEVLGGTEDDIVGLDWFQNFVPERSRAIGRETLQKLLSGGIDKLREFETPVLTREGRERLIEWHNTVLTDEDGRITGTLSSGLDVTERRRMTRELMEKDSLARLGEMAAVVAHEVRNPLAGISGAIQIIGSNLSKDSADRAIVREIVARIDALNATVNDILLFARPRLPRPIPFAMLALWEEMAAHVRRDALFHAVEVTVGGEDVRVKGDPELLKPVFLNLLVNAAQAMKEKGKITIGISERDRHCVIAVADTGPGIPAEIRQKVFEPFFSTKNRGTGLGLSIAKRLVEAHGGQISLDCPPSGGTVISILLPLAGPKLAEVPANA